MMAAHASAIQARSRVSNAGSVTQFPQQILRSFLPQDHGAEECRMTV
jgi:hypothetical protein